MPDRTLTLQGVEAPRFFYGTAWKEDQTQHLVELALQQGFRGIDTANQRRHYNEAAVGRAISASVAKGLIVREDVFLQTKFTFRGGQQHRRVQGRKSVCPQLEPMRRSSALVPR